MKHKRALAVYIISKVKVVYKKYTHQAHHISGYLFNFYLLIERKYYNFRFRRVLQFHILTGFITYFLNNEKMRHIWLAYIKHFKYLRPQLNIIRFKSTKTNY